MRLDRDGREYTNGARAAVYRVQAIIIGTQTALHYFLLRNERELNKSNTRNLLIDE